MRNGSSSKVLRGVAIALVVMAGVVVGTSLMLPTLVRSLLVREARARGVELEIGSAEVGLSAIALQGVSFSRQDGSLSGSAEQIEIEAGLFELVRDRREAIRAVRVERASISARLGPRERAGEEEPPAEHGRELPTIEIRDLAILVSDEAGELANARLERASLEGDRFVAAIQHVALGHGEPPLVRAEGVQLAGHLSARTISRVEMETLDLSALSDETRTSSWLERVRALRGEAAADGHANEEPSSSRYARLVERLDPSFRFGSRKTILPHESEREAFVLDGFGVERGAATKMRVHGQGRGPASSRAVFDLDLDVLHLRAGGKVEIERLPLDAVAALVPQIPWYEPERGVLDAKFDLEAKSREEIAFDGTLEVMGLGLDSPRVASEPIVGLDFSIAGTGRWNVDARRLSIENGAFGLGKAKVVFRGEGVIDPAAWSLSLKAKLPRTPCEDAVHAFPAAILGGAAGFQLRGTISGDLTLAVEGASPDDLELDIRVDDQCRFVDWPKHADPGRFHSLFVHEALDPNREPFDFETGPRTEVWTDLEEVSPYLIAAVLAHEDAGFFRHKGFSTFAIRGSLARNLATGRFERGASTISMQLAKNLFLNREKVLVRKLREVIYTWWLEKGFGKERILELYLNVVEFGPYIYGVRNASLHYFGRQPSELSPAEAAFLATILPSPSTGAIHHERGALSKSAKNRVASLLRNMEKRELLSKEAAEYGLEEIETFHFHREGDPLPPPRTLPPTHELFERTFRPGRAQPAMHADDFDPWGFP